MSIGLANPIYAIREVLFTRFIRRVVGNNLISTVQRKSTKPFYVEFAGLFKYCAGHINLIAILMGRNDSRSTIY